MEGGGPDGVGREERGRCRRNALVSCRRKNGGKGLG